MELILCNQQNLSILALAQYSSIFYTGGPLRKPIKFKRSSSGIVIGAFRSILLLSILKAITKLLVLAEQKYDFVPLHNYNLRRKTRVPNLTMIDNTLKL